MINEMIVCGRIFTAAELEIIREIIQRDSINRAQISREVCRVLNWFKPDGKLKEMSCRVALLRLHRLGILELPPPRHADPNRSRHRPMEFTSISDPGVPIMYPLSGLGTIQLVHVTQSKPSRLWNELIQRYHYLGYSPLPGAQIRYLVYSGSGTLLGAIGFSAAAWSLRPRDTMIGWNKEQRTRRLNEVVNNSRFLILPWVQVKNLASKVLGLSVKQLPKDWQTMYSYKPVLIETFVEKERFLGTCYKAANWRYIGDTQGRGKWDPKNEHAVPIKAIYIYPLNKNYNDLLNRSD